MKHEVVYAEDYCGFGLSDTAVDWLANNATDKGLIDFIAKLKNSHESNLGNRLSKWFEDKRHHKDLVSLVKHFNSNDSADHSLSHLSIEDIDEDCYYIEEYDGSETVHTPNSIHWIKIK